MVTIFCRTMSIYRRCMALIKIVTILNRYNFYSFFYVYIYFSRRFTHAHFEEQTCKFNSNTSLTRALCVTVKIIAYYQQYKNDGGGRLTIEQRKLIVESLINFETRQKFLAKFQFWVSNKVIWTLNSKWNKDVTARDMYVGR